eukprot:g7862.t1
MEISEVQALELYPLYEALQMYEAEMHEVEPEHPLLQAVQAGRIAELKNLLGAGTDVNSIRSPFDGSSALHYAAMHGRSRIAQMLLKHKADKEALDHAGETPLIKAAELGEQPVVEILLNAGADANVVSCSCARGRAALHFAAGEGHHGIVQALLNHGADVDAQDDKGYTPIMWAIFGGSLPTAEILLAAGADVAIRNNNGVAALHGAAGEGHNAIASALLQAGASKDVLDLDGDTPLIWASRSGHLPVVKTLVNAGANLNVRGTDDEGLAALHVAAAQGYNRVVRTLLASGANKDILDELGQTPLTVAEANRDALDCYGERPLIWAVAEGHVPLVESLLAAGVNITVRRRSDGGAALHIAAGGGHDNIVSTLLRKGAYKNVLDNKGTTPLLWATAAGHLATVETLLAAGANFNLRSRDDGFSALHLAAGQGYHKIVSALLRRGADTDVADPNGDTALMWAAGNGDLRIVEILLAAGADVTVRNNVEGYSAFDWATTGGHVGVQEAILRHTHDGTEGDDIEGGCKDMHLGPRTDPADPAQALDEDEFNFARQGVAGSARLADGGGRSFRGVLAVPGWPDVESICLAVALCLWFSARCKVRS